MSKDKLPKQNNTTFIPAAISIGHEREIYKKEVGSQVAADKFSSFVAVAAPYKPSR